MKSAWIDWDAKLKNANDNLIKLLEEYVFEIAYAFKLEQKEWPLEWFYENTPGSLNNLMSSSGARISKIAYELLWYNNESWTMRAEFGAETDDYWKVIKYDNRLKLKKMIEEQNIKVINEYC